MEPEWKQVEIFNIHIYDTIPERITDSKAPTVESI